LLAAMRKLGDGAEEEEEAECDVRRRMEAAALL
jgi:hypothetical protein